MQFYEFYDNAFMLYFFEKSRNSTSFLEMRNTSLGSTISY